MELARLGRAGGVSAWEFAVRGIEVELSREVKLSRQVGVGARRISVRVA